MMKNIIETALKETEAFLLGLNSSQKVQDTINRYFELEKKGVFICGSSASYSVETDIARALQSHSLEEAPEFKDKKQLDKIIEVRKKKNTLEKQIEAEKKKLISLQNALTSVKKGAVAVLDANGNFNTEETYNFVVSEFNKEIQKAENELMKKEVGLRIAFDFLKKVRNLDEVLKAQEAFLINLTHKFYQSRILHYTKEMFPDFRVKVEFISKKPISTVTHREKEHTYFEAKILETIKKNKDNFNLHLKKDNSLFLVGKNMLLDATESWRNFEKKKNKKLEKFLSENVDFTFKLSSALKVKKTHEELSLNIISSLDYEKINEYNKIIEEFNSSKVTHSINEAFSEYKIEMDLKEDVLLKQIHGRSEIKEHFKSISGNGYELIFS